MKTLLTNFNPFKKPAIKAKTKQDYVRMKLEQGHRLSQLGFYKMCERDRAYEFFSTDLRTIVSQLRKKNVPIQKDMINNGKSRYAEYYI